MPPLPPFKYGEVYTFNAEEDEFTINSEYSLNFGNKERLEWGVANWSKPYGFRFYSNEGSDWYFENLEGEYFRAEEIQTTYNQEDNEYLVKIFVSDLESVGKFVVKNRKYDGEYTFTAVE